jgi:hypothetical protein
VVIYQDKEPGWKWPVNTAKKLEWDEKRLQVRTPQKVDAPEKPLR